MKTNQHQNSTLGQTFTSQGTLLAAFAACLLWGHAASHAQGPGVFTDRSAYYPGDPISVTFERGPANAADWIGIYPNGVEPGSVGSTLWNYVGGTQTATVGKSEGVIVFPNGLASAGDWVAYLLLNDGYTKLASVKFKVLEAGATIVQTDKRSYSPGEEIRVSFKGGPGNSTDWIGIYPKGVVPGPTPSTRWFYVNGTQSATTGITEGTLIFAGGLTASGEYEVHFLRNDGYDIAATETFSVVQAAGSRPRLLSLLPANNSTDQPPVLEFMATITNGASKVAASSVSLKVDGASVVPVVSTVNDLVTIAYTNQALMAPVSTHAYLLTYADNGSPAMSFTHEGSFTVGDYRSIVLPAPLFFEDFEGTAEGALPTGWTQVNFTDIQNQDLDLENLDSASYATWTVVNSDRFKGSFVTYSNPENPQAWEEDYRRVLTLNRRNVLNGKILNQPLAAGKFLFGNSGYRNGRGQVLHAFTPDFNLSGKTDVHVAYHSLWEQNQDSIAAVEYSIDGGQNWLSIVYMLDGPDVKRDESGQIDAIATFTDEHGDTARYTDPGTGEDKGASYGSFIGAVISKDLAPFISVRVNDNASESKRVELFRIAKADNQSKVRFRFTHAGTDSWYFGVDNFGLYSIPPAPVETPKLSFSISGASVTIAWPAALTGFVLESADAIVGAAWTAVTGTANNSITLNASAGSKFYRLRQP